MMMEFTGRRHWTTIDFGDWAWNDIVKLHSDVRMSRLAVFNELSQDQEEYDALVRAWDHTAYLGFWRKVEHDKARAAAYSRDEITSWIKEAVPIWVAGAFCKDDSQVLIDAMAILNADVVKNPYDRDVTGYEPFDKIRRRKHAEILIDGYVTSRA